jgi:hypothetical protein
MSQKEKITFADSTQLEHFLAAPASTDRLAILNQWKNDGLSIKDDFLAGLFNFPLSRDEFITAFDIVMPRHRATFELWILNHLMKWEQNIAASAIRAWATSTDRILWHRLIPLATNPGLPQRIRYTILDMAPHTHGFEIIRAILESPSWEDLSPAFQALLFERCLQFDIADIRLNSLAWSTLDQHKSSAFPEDKRLTAAICWLCKYDERRLEDWLSQRDQYLWVQAALVLLHQERILIESEKKSKSRTSTKNIVAKKSPLIPVWSKKGINAADRSFILSNPFTGSSVFYDTPSKLIHSTSTIPEGMDECWKDMFIGRMPYNDCVNVEFQGSTAFSQSYNKFRYPELHAARCRAISGQLGIANDTISASRSFSSEEAYQPPTDHPFMIFINATNAPTDPIADGNTSWHSLARAWLSPNLADLNAITTATRKGCGLMALAHIKLMAKMKGRDDAVLKLLDHIRSDDEIAIRSVVTALGLIDTPRSLLELINMITRPNASLAVKQDIVTILGSKNLAPLQKELRAVIHDFVLPENTEHPLYQIRDELSTMLIPIESEASRTHIKEPHQSPNGVNLDQELTGMIPYYNSLSSEVKRALRTALFFNKTVYESKHKSAIDLSPLIDMQYKALELLYREFFEEYVSQILQKGSVQRKLDVIGYARPIVRNMDDFESFIASLPIVKDIPFFSKFKLRKMLRALCQFEPGKRFTLDGLKAFGLFFLVFGRQSCKFGLANLVITGAREDRDLAELARELHIFQDFRNRAAHEGFHPDASNDIIGIWRNTALLVQWAFRAKDAQKTSSMASLKNAS